MLGSREHARGRAAPCAEGRMIVGQGQLLGRGAPRADEFISEYILRLMENDCRIVDRRKGRARPCADGRCCP